MISQNVTAPRRKNYHHSLTLFVALVPFRWKIRFDSVQLTNQYGFCRRKNFVLQGVIVRHLFIKRSFSQTQTDK
jgi:hypothetical protein